jgi:hypothetical protein
LRMQSRSEQRSSLTEGAGQAANVANKLTHQGCPHPSSTISTRKHKRHPAAAVAAAAGAAAVRRARSARLTAAAAAAVTVARGKGSRFGGGVE